MGAWAIRRPDDAVWLNNPHELNTETEGNAPEFGADTTFTWPTDPPREWWEIQGGSVKLSEDQVRFAAALHALGGANAKKHSAAARNAGLKWDRVQAFRVARSATVTKLLREAWEIKEGKREPLSEQEIDWRIENLIRSPDAQTCAKGIELREKRKTAKSEAEKEAAKNGSNDPRETLRKIAEKDRGLAFALSQKYGIDLDLGGANFEEYKCPTCGHVEWREVEKSKPSDQPGDGGNGHVHP